MKPTIPEFSGSQRTAKKLAAMEGPIHFIHFSACVQGFSWLIIPLFLKYLQWFVHCWLFSWRDDIHNSRGCPVPWMIEWPMLAPLWRSITHTYSFFFSFFAVLWHSRLVQPVSYIYIYICLCVCVKFPSVSKPTINFFESVEGNFTRTQCFTFYGHYWQTHLHHGFNINCRWTNRLTMPDTSLAISNRSNPINPNTFAMKYLPCNIAFQLPYFCAEINTIFFDAWKSPIPMDKNPVVNSESRSRKSRSSMKSYPDAPCMVDWC